MNGSNQLGATGMTFRSRRSICTIRRARYDDAIRILHLGTLEDLHNTGGMSYAFTLIGDCYREKGEIEMALVYYKKAVELDGGNLNAKGLVRSCPVLGKRPNFLRLVRGLF
jgi:hypothetical protein